VKTPEELKKTEEKRQRRSFPNNLKESDTILLLNFLSPLCSFKLQEYFTSCYCYIFESISECFAAAKKKKKKR